MLFGQLKNGIPFEEKPFPRGPIQAFRYLDREQRNEDKQRNGGSDIQCSFYTEQISKRKRGGDQKCGGSESG